LRLRDFLLASIAELDLGETSLAIYDALLQAGVAEAPARRIVDSLEQDMTTLLAIKQDLLMVRQDLRHLDEQLALRLQSMESRIVIRLSLVMAGLFSVSGTVIALLR
jgi:hypothetical protein